MSVIRIHRGGGYADLWRAYKIILDGDLAGRISAKSTLDINATPGTHTVVAKIDWASSQELVVDVAEDETVELDVANTYGAAKALFAISAGKDNYLTLTERSDP